RKITGTFKWRHQTSSPRPHTWKRRPTQAQRPNAATGGSNCSVSHVPSVLWRDGDAPALEQRGLRAADRVLHAALAVGVTRPRRVGHDAVAGQRGGVD